MKKKGQTTIFMIVGVIIVLIIAVYYLLLPKSSSDIINFEEFNTIPISDNVNICLKQTVLDGVYEIGKRGGYLEIPGDVVPAHTTNAAVWTQGNKDNSPTDLIVEYQLSNYVNSYLSFCLSQIQSPEYELDIKNGVSKINIEDNRIIATLNMPVVITQKNMQRTQEKFMVIVDSNFGEVLSQGRAIAKVVSDNPTMFDYTFIDSLKYDVLISEVDELRKLFTIKFDDYYLMFGVKLHPTNSAPVLYEIPDITTTINTPIVLQIKAVDPDNDPVYYEISPDYIGIDTLSGKFSYSSSTPEVIQAVVTAKDDFNNYDFERFTITIK